MFTVIKRLEISASHKLVLPYRSKCASLHGHNWIITVYCRSARLNADGMVVDFTRIKEVVMEKLGDGFVMIKGYNRFSKPGAPGFEMHGGATIEEQVVPFLVIERAIVLDNAASSEQVVAPATGVADQISENDDFDI